VIRLLVILVAAAALVLAGLGAGYLLWGDGEDDAGPAGGTRTQETDGDTQEQSGPGGCDLEDASGCVPGAELVLTDDQWRCRGPLAEIAAELGGTLPLKVTARFTTFVTTSGPVIDLREGCVGDGTDAIDLILDVQGDGRTYGGTNDAVSVKLDARDIEVTGKVNCGPRPAGGHQDGVQGQGGMNVTFVDFEVGDWDDERATCTGASGGIDFSGGGGMWPVGHACIRCRVVACRRALNVGESEGIEVVDSRFRSGNPAETQEELATGEIGLCTFQVSVCNVDPTARDHVFADSVCEEYPYRQDGARR
jgi:hypothetical protein